MPQMNSNPAIARTKSRRSSAKSTKLRIMTASRRCSLLDAVLEDEGVRHDAIAGMQTRHDILQLARSHRTGDDLLPPEPAVAGRHVHPIAIVQVQDGARRHDGVDFVRLSVKRRRDEHADAHHAGIGYLDADLRGANRGIEDGSDIAD